MKTVGAVMTLFYAGAAIAQPNRQFNVAQLLACDLRVYCAARALHVRTRADIHRARATTILALIYFFAGVTVTGALAGAAGTFPAARASAINWST